MDLAERVDGSGDVAQHDVRDALPRVGVPAAGGPGAIHWYCGEPDAEGAECGGASSGMTQSTRT